MEDQLTNGKKNWRISLRIAPIPAALLFPFYLVRYRL